MRKFLRNFFWSHGAPLGYLGSLSQKGHPEIFSKWVLINLSNPLRHPAPLVDPLLTKTLIRLGHGVTLTGLTPQQSCVRTHNPPPSISFSFVKQNVMVSFVNVLPKCFGSINKEIIWNKKSS